MMSNSDDSASSSPAGRMAWWQRYPWLPLILPFAVYMLAGQLEPKHTELPPPVAVDRPVTGDRAEAEPDSAHRSDTSDGRPVRAGTSNRRYALAYGVRLTLTLLTVVFTVPYYRTVRFRLHAVSVVVGLLGGGLWILLCRLRLEQQFFSALSVPGWLVPGQRAAFDPLTAFAGTPAILAAFLAVRFLGLVLVVPLVEEFFLRGFLMRFFLRADWWTIPWGEVTMWSALIATGYGVLSHPAEAVAAAVWFSLITMLYVRTRSIWDCVLAHGVTNLVLGIYVLMWRDWSLW